MSRIVLLLASAALAVLLTTGVVSFVVEEPADAAFPGKNGKIAFVSNRTTGEGVDNPTGDNEIFTVNPDGTSLAQITNDTGHQASPAYSPDGSRIAYEASSEIYTISANGGAPILLTNNAEGGQRPSYSADGSKIAYDGYDGNDSEIYTVSVNGGTSTKITDNNTNDMHPVYSPDGSKIAYMGRANGWDIFTIGVNGGTPTNLTNESVGNDMYPDWAPDSSKIVYTGGHEGGIEGDWEILTVEAAPGSTPTRLTANTTHELEPHYSPDGSKIVYHQGSGNEQTVNYTVNTIDANGGPPATVVEDGISASWQPVLDATTPVVDPPTQGFVTNSTLGTSAIPVKLAWSADDTALGYQLQQSTNGGAYQAVALPSATATSITRSLAPANNYQFRVRAQDQVGNWSDWASGSSFKIEAYQESDAAISYLKAWSRQTLSSAYGGALKHAKGTGAEKATFAFRGSEVAWVAPRTTNRGKADVYLDGSKVATIDLYAASGQSRKVVFTKAGLDASVTHTLEVRVLGSKNAASSGKRVDVDAFVALR